MEASSVPMSIAIRRENMLQNCSVRSALTSQFDYGRRMGLGARSFPSPCFYEIPKEYAEDANPICDQERVP